MNLTANPRCFLLAAVVTCVSLGCIPGSRDADLRRRGDEIITKVEQFRRDSARLPQSLGAIGIEETETGPLYYDKLTDTSYVVWFGTTLGESVIWSSSTKTWDPPAKR